MWGEGGGKTVKGPVREEGGYKEGQGGRGAVRGKGGLEGGSEKGKAIVYVFDIFRHG